MDSAGRWWYAPTYSWADSAWRGILVERQLPVTNVPLTWDSEQIWGERKGGWHQFQSSRLAVDSRLCAGRSRRILAWSDQGRDITLMFTLGMRIKASSEPIRGNWHRAHLVSIFACDLRALFLPAGNVAIGIQKGNRRNDTLRWGGVEQSTRLLGPKNKNKGGG